jgi:hypothetical protein
MARSHLAPSGRSCTGSPTCCSSGGARILSLPDIYAFVFDGEAREAAERVLVAVDEEEPVPAPLFSVARKLGQRPRIYQLVEWCEVDPALHAHAVTLSDASENPRPLLLHGRQKRRRWMEHCAKAAERYRKRLGDGRAGPRGVLSNRILAQ